MTAVGVESQIVEALLTRLAALALSPAVPVAYPDVTFPATGTTKPDTYLDAKRLPAGARAIGISAWNEYPGIFQVDVVTKKGGGAIKSTQIADAVAAWFPRGTSLTNGGVQVDIYDPPAIAPSIDDDPYTRIPVSIRYRTFKR